ncbi:N-acetylglucosamine-6-phosphate deacetylase [Pseudonocardia sp. TMWB2A]|uniref:N-acetylglucosamine-6-phosphate deacetylase n=1 Tax=Pseudonocardia sp. TMWB2A TaxID=687430 RepID=UPI00307E4F68
MTRIALTGAAILTGGALLHDHALVMAEGRIEAVIPVEKLDADLVIEPLDGGTLVPGFIDTQVNGGGGVLFNDSPTVDGLATIAEAHRRFGTTAFLPTLISDDLQVVAAAIAAVDAAIEAGVPGIAGIHIEGPFLNTGKKGIHNAAKFRVLDEEALALLGSLKHGRTLVTLAPENAPPGAIRALVEGGVIVAAGHSLASYEAMERAVDEGLSAVTHLYNAMTGLESRAPGVVGAALDHGLTSGIIVDGHHVHPAALRVAYKALGPERLMLVTDAMPTTGWDQEHFLLGETEIFARDGTLRGGDGTLAGSALDMAGAVRNAVGMMGVGLAEASIMASRTPARLLGMETQRGTIAAGYAADLVHLDDALEAQKVWIAGGAA